MAAYQTSLPFLAANENIEPRSHWSLNCHTLKAFGRWGRGALRGEYEGGERKEGRERDGGTGEGTEAEAWLFSLHHLGPLPAPASPQWLAEGAPQPPVTGHQKSADCTPATMRDNYPSPAPPRLSRIDEASDVP